MTLDLSNLTTCENCLRFVLCVAGCACVYDSVEGLMGGVRMVIDRIKKGDTPLKKVIRIKNLAVENKKDAMALARKQQRLVTQDDWLYQYFDIKLNVEWSCYICLQSDLFCVCFCV